MRPLQLLRRPTVSRAVRPMRPGFLLLAAAALLAGCGSDDSTASTNPAPVLLSVTPLQLAIGPDTASVNLSGSGFTPSSRVRVNGRDHASQYRSPTSIQMPLSRDEMAVINIFQISVVNDAPGGGTSDTISLEIGYPKPVITAMSATKAVLPALASDTITITGTGFVPLSRVWLGENATATVVSVTPTTLSFRLSGLGPIGTYDVQVRTTTPGGGNSNTLPLTVEYRVPTITRVFPDTLLASQGRRTVTVNGTGFIPTTVFFLNGAGRSSEKSTDSTATVTVDASDLQTPGTLQLTARNPSPTAGASVPVAIHVVPAPPIISSFTPASINAGAPQTVLTVAGAQFEPLSQLLWNGAPLATTVVSSTQLTATVPASLLAAAGTAVVAVRSPARTGPSSAYAILSGTQALEAPIIVAMAGKDVVWVPQRNRLYASVMSGPATESVVSIDPTSGSITSTMAVPEGPGPLAASDDGRYLYVAHRYLPSLSRRDLAANGSEDLSFDVGPIGTLALDIAPIPGSPRSVLLARTIGTAPLPILAYDDGVARPDRSDVTPHSSRVEVVSATEAIGLDTYSSAATLRRYRISATGIQDLEIRPGGFSALYSNGLQYESGRLFTSDGEIADAGTLSTIGALPRVPSGVRMQVVADASQGRIYVVGNLTLRVYSFTSLSLLSTTPIPDEGYEVVRVVRFGTNGLAILTDTKLVLLRGTVIGN